ncbi:branched-chain amino acid ABC transporter substrate-binding protein [soil metagenome]|nr:ABC transporter substrate-binding protein [Gemmatimonadota bacterium]
MPLMIAPDVRCAATRRNSPRAVAASLLLVLSAGCSDSSQPVVFGLAGPFSQSYGESMKLGAELGAREINASGGIAGRPLQLRALDDHASPERAIAVAHEFFSDPAVIAVVGHVNSGTMLEAGGVYSQGLPAMATSATSPAISRLGPWVFRAASSDSANAVELARLARRLTDKTAILYENDGYGRGLAGSFRSALEAAGTRVLSADPYLPTTEDFTPYLERLRQSGVELIFVAGLEEGAARMIRQARDLGIDAQFLGGDGLEGLLGMGDLYNGTRVGLLFHTDQSPEARSFAQRFRAEYGREADSFAALGYDAVRLMARAAEKGRSRGAVRDYLAEVGSAHPAFDGVTGRIAFDSNGDPKDKAFAVGTIRSGSITLTEGAR